MALQTQTSLGAHQFNGPHTNNNTIPAVSGVYIITTLAPNQKYTVIDVGESHNIKDRVSSHDRSEQWRNHIQTGLHAWVLGASEAERMLIEKAHRIAYNPACGMR